MRLTVLGGCGAWPAAGQACSGYLVEHDGFTVLLDPGYAVLPRMLTHINVEDLDAVLVSHGHPDHCADLNPLLRARAFSDDPAPPLPVYAPPHALTAVLALDRKGMLDDAIAVSDITPGDPFTVGPFDVRTWPLPHMLPNAGLRLTADGQTIAYTGDTGPAPELIDLARDAHIFLAEASYPRAVPADMARHLSSAAQAGRTAAQANVQRLVLTHLMPGTNADEAIEAAAASFTGEISVATAAQ
ncbi:MAG TPA: MBL fold metallo-hydrolase [Streptosporangiaceae bacterium]|nr:MBL fold metallo-hydrolase [Streptosporangiaceae bacterium]